MTDDDRRASASTVHLPATTGTTPELHSAV